MSRNSSGTYTLPAGNPVVSGTVITSTWGNTTMNDIATALTDSLSRTGQGSMLAGLPLFAGTSGLPGLTWGAELTSGIYRAGAGDFRWVVSTVELLRYNNNLLQLSGTAPAFRINETNASADQRLWDFIANNGELHFRILLDNLTATNVIDFTRSSGTATGVTITANTITTAGAFVNSFAGAIATPSVSIGSTQPVFELNETDGPTNEKKWSWVALSGQLQLRAVNDAGSASTTFLTVDRTATTVDLISLANFSAFTAVPSTSGEPLQVISTNPRIGINETDAAANNRLWWLEATGAQLRFACAPDDRSTSTAFMTITRGGAAATVINFAGSAGNFQYNGQTIWPRDSNPAAWDGQQQYLFSGSPSSATMLFNSTRPVINWFESGVTADNALWSLDFNGEAMNWRIANDIASVTTPFMTVERTGTTVDSVNLQGTDIQANGLSLAASGSFSGTLSGMSAGGTGTIFWKKNGGMVTLHVKSSAVTGTSNTTAMVLSSLPVAIRPGYPQICACQFTNNGVDIAGYMVVGFSAADTASAQAGTSFTGFTAAGTKGLPAGWTVTYAIN